MLEHRSNRISNGQERGRSFALHHKDTLLPTNIEHIGDGLQRVIELHKKGYSLIPMTTHPTKMDELHEYPILWEIPDFANTAVIVPTAYDQCTPIVRILAHATGVRIKPVVTQEVIRRGGNDTLPRGYGNMGYIRDAVRATNDPEDPGIIFLAPDAGRSPELKAPDTRAAEFLLTATKDAKIAVLFMGVEVEGADDYRKADGFNLRKTYTIRVGNAYTNEEILQTLPYFRNKFDIPNPRPNRRPFFGVEAWMYATQFPSLVPDAYKSYQADLPR